MVLTPSVLSGKCDIFLMEGPCLHTVPASDPLSRTTEECIALAMGNQHRVYFCLSQGLGSADGLQPGCAWVFLLESHIPPEIFTTAEIMGY